jgi:hypothetical protein
MPNINNRKQCLQTDEDINIFRKSSMLEVCDILIIKPKDLSKFTEHLTATNLFKAEKHGEYSKKFPLQYFEFRINCCPFFDTKKLKTELKVLYFRNDFQTLNDIIPTLKYIIENDTNETFKEVFILLKILITIPMTSFEATRCFSTLKRIKTCLRNTMREEKLTSLAMLSIKNEMIFQ